MSVVASLIDAGIAAANYGLQKSNLDWQRQAQERVWQREDSAVQRRVADLQAAGLSPVLAAGSAASSSGPISISAPQIDFSAEDKARMAMDLAQQKVAIAHTAAETQAKELQNRKDKIDTDVYETMFGSPDGS